MDLKEDNNLYDKEKIISIIKSQESIDLFKKQNINSVILFGSIATDEFEDYSDVDIAILSKDEIKLDSIMDLEDKLSTMLKREIDIVDLNGKEIDLRFKVSVYDDSVVVYNDELDLYTKDYNKTDIIYKNNEEFRYFRERDVIYSE